jgi:hypothetical protein
MLPCGTEVRKNCREWDHLGLVRKIEGSVKVNHIQELRGLQETVLYEFFVSLVSS